MFKDPRLAGWSTIDNKIQAENLARKAARRSTVDEKIYDYITTHSIHGVTVDHKAVIDWEPGISASKIRDDV